MTNSNRSLLHFNPIGFVESCYPEKFGVPRQPGLVEKTLSKIVIEQPYSTPDAFELLTEFSHIWVIFHFHESTKKGWKPKVRPPRLGGNKKVGTFASRSPFRPNPIGLSAVRLLNIDFKDQIAELTISGGDFVDGTPVLDIKPYLPYVDSVEATGGYAEEKPSFRLNVELSSKAKEFCKLAEEKYPNLEEIIIETLALDPRPAYQEADKEREYGISIYDLNIKWFVDNETATVTIIEPVGSKNSK